MSIGLSIAAMLAVPGCGKRTHALTVGFSQEGAESDWRAANTASIRKAAADAGVELKFTDSQEQVQSQIRALDTFAQQRLDVVAFSPQAELGWEPVLQRLREANIPVIVSDRNVKVSDPSLQPIFIGSDLRQEGRRAGAWLAGHTKGRCRVVILEGNAGSTPTLDRTGGFEEAIKPFPGITVVERRNGDFKRALGKERMETILKSPEGRDLTALYAENDDMAIGAIQALEAAGKRPGKDVLVISIDAGRDALQLLIDGKLNCSIECNPLLGPAIMDAARRLHNHEAVPARVITDEALFDDPEQVRKIIGARQY
jgi:ABC-type sugar transport system substrate-binding protein